MNTNTTAPTGVVSSTELGQPIAYLYHDASTPKDAHPWHHSTLLVLAADRKPGLRGETPLVTLEQADAMVAAERAWFVQALSEWDSTQDVENVLRLRLEDQNTADDGSI